MLGKLASLYLEGPCASLLCVVDEVLCNKALDSPIRWVGVIQGI